MIKNVNIIDLIFVLGIEFKLAGVEVMHQWLSRALIARYFQLQGPKFVDNLSGNPNMSETFFISKLDKER